MDNLGNILNLEEKMSWGKRGDLYFWVTDPWKTILRSPDIANSHWKERKEKERGRMDSMNTTTLTCNMLRSLTMHNYNYYGAQGWNVPKDIILSQAPF